MGLKARSPAPLIGSYWPLTRVVMLVEADPETASDVVARYYRRNAVHPSVAHQLSVLEQRHHTLADALKSLLPLSRSPQRWIVLPTIKPGWSAVFSNSGEANNNLITRLSRKGETHLIECDGQLAKPTVVSFRWVVEHRGRAVRNVVFARGKCLWSTGRPLEFESPPITPDNVTSDRLLETLAAGGYEPHRDRFYAPSDAQPAIGVALSYPTSLGPTASLAAARARRLTRGSIF